MPTNSQQQLSEQIAKHVAVTGNAVLSRRLGNQISQQEWENIAAEIASNVTIAISQDAYIDELLESDQLVDKKGRPNGKKMIDCLVTYTAGHPEVGGVLTYLVHHMKQALRTVRLLKE